MIDTKKYRPARQNMMFVTSSLRSLANKLHILAQQADICGINQLTLRKHICIMLSNVILSGGRCTVCIIETFVKRNSENWYHLNEWVSVVKRQIINCSAISWRIQVNFQWNDDDDVRFVLDQHAELDFYSASWLKQQSVDRHVASRRHSILTPSQPVVAFSPWCCMLNGEAANTNFIVFGLTFDLNPRSTAV